MTLDGRYFSIVVTYRLIHFPVYFAKPLSKESWKIPMVDFGESKLPIRLYIFILVSDDGDRDILNPIYFKLLLLF